MADGMLALSWNNHATTFCHMLSQIRQKDKYTDATVACEGKFYPVHRIVLSTCSKYFEEMFEQTSAGKHPIVLLQDVKKYELEAILSYMYAGVVSVAQKDLSRLIKIAELLQIKGLAVPDELPSEKKVVANQSSGSERTSNIQHKASHSIDSSDERASPYRKRRRREERVTSPQAIPSSANSSKSLYNRDDDEIQEIQASSRELDDRLGGERVEETNTNVESRVPSTSDHETNERLHQQQTSQHASGKPVKDANDEMVWIKEEVLDDPGDSEGNSGMVKSEMYGSIDDAGEESVDMALDDQGKYSPASHGQIPPPLSEPVAEALAGPSGIHEWLSGGDLATGLSAMDNYGGEGSPPTSDHPQSQQMDGTGGANGQSRWRDVPRIPSSAERPQKASHFSASSDISLLYGYQDQSASSPANLAKLTCPYCPAMFTRRNHVIQHIRTHTGEKPYLCPHCSAAFAQKCNLIVHLRIHTGEKPYRCSYCEARFARKTSRDIHMASSHHNNTSSVGQ